MYREHLTERFFQENLCMEISAQRIVYSTLLSAKHEEAAAKIVMEDIGIGDDRLERIAREKETILAQNDPEMIFQLMRKNLDVINRPVLIERALAFEAAIPPMVVEKLVAVIMIYLLITRSVFWEEANRITHRCFWSDTEFRRPYVQSILCIILVIRGPEDTIPWMLDRFYEMKKLYPDENYDQGPLLALRELNARFFSD